MTVSDLLASLPRDADSTTGARPGPAARTSVTIDLAAPGGQPPAETPAEAAAALPPRVAHGLHALMVRWSDKGEAVTAAEVCEYDSGAPTVRHTAAALTRARKLGLAGNLAPGLWFATGRAWAMRAALEKRFRAEVDGG
jgi:hypothetical protein